MHLSQRYSFQNFVYSLVPYNYCPTSCTLPFLLPFICRILKWLSFQLSDVWRISVLSCDFIMHFTNFVLSPVTNSVSSSLSNFVSSSCKISFLASVSKFVLSPMYHSICLSQCLMGESISPGSDSQTRLSLQSVTSSLRKTVWSSWSIKLCRAQIRVVINRFIRYSI